MTGSWVDCYAEGMMRLFVAISLPDDVDAERVQASYRDGVIQIEIGRREASRPRTIKVS